MQVTAVDKQKLEADILLTAITGSSYTINIKNPDVDLGGKRGIQKIVGNGFVHVTERKWNWLREKYVTMVDF